MFKVINLQTRKQEKSFDTYSAAVLYATNQHNRIYRAIGVKVRFRITKE